MQCYFHTPIHTPYTCKLAFLRKKTQNIFNLSHAPLKKKRKEMKECNSFILDVIIKCMISCCFNRTIIYYTKTNYCMLRTISMINFLQSYLSFDKKKVNSFYELILSISMFYGETSLSIFK